LKQKEKRPRRGPYLGFAKGLWRAKRNEDGHGEHFEIKVGFSKADPRLEASSESRRLAESFVLPYAKAQPKEGEECPHLEIVDLIAERLSISRKRAYRAVYRAMKYFDVPKPAPRVERH